MTPRCSHCFVPPWRPGGPSRGSGPSHGSPPTRQPRPAGPMCPAASVRRALQDPQAREERPASDRPGAGRPGAPTGSPGTSAGYPGDPARRPVDPGRARRPFRGKSLVAQAICYAVPVVGLCVLVCRRAARGCGAQGGSAG